MEVKSNVKEACRLCLRGEGKISVFDNDDNPGNITAESVYKCVSVKITQDDKLPTGICGGCLQSVANWCTFKTTCDRTQEILQGWLSEDILGEKDDCRIFEDDIESSSCDAFKIPDEQVYTTKPDLPSQPVASPSSSSASLEKEQDTNFRPDENKNVDDNECLPSSNAIPEQENLPPNPDNVVESQSESREKDALDTVTPMDVSEFDDRSSQDNECVDMCDSVVNISESSTSKNNVDLKNEMDCKYDSLDSVHIMDEAASLSNEKLNVQSDLALEPQKENVVSDDKKTSEPIEICLDVDDSSSVELLTEVQEKSKSGTETSLQTVLDSDVENSMPSSCISENSTKTDISKERVDDASSLCEDFHSVPFTAAVTIDVNPFNNKNEHEGQESLQSCPDKSLADTMTESESTQLPSEKEKEANDHPPQIREVESVTPLPQDAAEPDVVSSSVSPPIEKIDEKEGEVSSSVEKQCPSPPQVEREGDFDKSAEISSEQRAELEDNSLPLMVQIKEEPIDSTTDDNPQNFVRVKSEFATFNFENEPTEDQSWEMGGGAWQPSGNPEDPNNTECFVCKRKYSSVSNYKAHLQTKMHLFNSGQTVETASTPKESPKEMTTTFESPLLRSRLSTGPLNQSFIDPSPPPSLSSSPVPKRKFVDHCGLCNVSFSFTSELRRHLFSKKHRFNTRIARMRSGRPEPSPMKMMPSQPMQYSRDPAPDGNSQGNSKSIFICPIQNCNFSCSTGESLLYHMQVHGIAQPTEKMPEPTPPKQKLSLRQQDLLRKETELRREAELKKKRDAELLMIRETELRMKREAELKMKREAEMRMKREAEMKMKREMEMKLMREAEMKQMKERQELLRQQMQGGPMPHFQCQGCHKLFVRESGLKKHSWYCTALTKNLKQELIEVDEEDLIEEVDEEEEEEPMIDINEDSGGSESHCPLCDISFTARNVFINHIQIYHKGSYLESSLPKSAPSTKKIPPKHSMRPIGKTPLLQTASKMRVTNKTHGFGCDICGKKFNLLSSLNFHLKTHTVSVRHVCRICKEPFTNRKAFMEHCRQHFLKPGSKETLCHKCFKVFKTRSELYHHRKNDQCAIKMKIYSCNYCQHSFKDPEALEEHKGRFHNSESLNAPQEEMQGSTYTEMYDDSIIPLNPLCLLSEGNENLPGTSKPSGGYSLNYNKQSVNPMKYGNTNPTNFQMKNSPTYNPSSSGMSSGILQCNICRTNFSSKASLKKHTLMFHILNKPYYGSRRYSSLKRGGILQSNLSKQWKCKHCKQAFLTRKVLVHHLKKCEHNSFEDMKGICLQCGKWCESGKTRICRFCLPDLPPDDSSLNENQIRNMNQMRMVEQMTSLNSQPMKNIKQEFDGSNSPFQGSGNLNEYQELQSNKSFSMTGSQSQIKAENIKKEFPAGDQMDIKPKASRFGHTVNINDINLMKCPVGNKYFRNEMIMVKHYSECDGSCENRCSHCRKLFNTPKEYKVHLLYSKCFKRNDTKKKPKLKYPTFACRKKKIRRDPPLSFDIKSQLHELDLKANIFKQTSDEFSDNTMDTTACSEDSSNIGVESTSSLANKAAEEKSLKLGRICLLCNKVITMQRAVYRHVYACCKTFLHTQDTVTCPKCNKTFTKQVTMKGNAIGLKQHVLDCHFVPYYIGQGVAEDGSRFNTPPQYLCYVCSFGFSCNETLMLHIKEHRTKKDEINNIVLQLEDELLSEERLADEESMLSYHIREITPTNVTPVLSGRVLSLQEQIDHSKQVLSNSVNIYNCETCGRKFYNRKKYLRHRMVHRIITKNVFSEPVKSFVDLEKDNDLLNTE